MSQTVITKAFEALKAQQGADNSPVTLDEFVFANVPDLNITDPIDRDEGVPDTSLIVHREAVTRTGRVNDNAVVYSVVLGAKVGDFEFNWIGLMNKASGTLAMIVHAPTQKKIATVEGQQGNVLTRSFLMEYSGAAEETQINTPAETWQIDFAARMAGMDERQRLENVDIYGAAAFFGDGWLVARDGAQYHVTGGTGYVAGLRAELAQNQDITVTTKPVKVWLDVSWQGTLTSVWDVAHKIAVSPAQVDYVKDGIQHYVFALAEIDADGNITDLRPKGSLAEQQGNSDFVRRDKNLSDLFSVSDARRNMGLGSAATVDAQISVTDTTINRLMRVGAFGLGGNRIEVSSSGLYDFFPGKPGGHYGAGSKDDRLTSGWLNAIWTQHGTDGKYGSLLEIGSDCGLALHIQSGMGVWSSTRFYSTEYKPSANDISAIAQDGCHIAGFRSGNSELPYMRHTSSGDVIELATRAWTNETFQPKGNFIAQDVCSMAGFRSGNSTLPYMRHTTSNTVIELATKSWVSENHVRDMRLGARNRQLMKYAVNYEVAGNVVTGLQIEGEVDGTNDYIVLRPLQKNINGTWYTVSQV
ncbi:hypothetical protein FEM41_01890 [Jejubacter calystegiae]|uniref:Phage tail fibre protein N-terminal domain-containing protein n=1 Tax=Jejubacter calystegiae TaxID=2579935 RepID=A0A4P8YNX4_9ENTR|nr:phage tail protein [Jejubacter calystegiae]QCT22580.1 hypothetical protein FEM41_01890 [Jejubacter calystegiae]